MPNGSNKLSQFWQELKRRRVIQVIVVYATAAFVIIELVDNVYETLNLPEWTPALTLIILTIGFLLAIIFSWIFDVTSDGIEKTKPLKEIQDGEKTKTPNSWRIATFVSAMIIAGLIIFQAVGKRKQTADIKELEKSIAVLPFENWNSDDEYEHLGDAIANELNTQLAKIKEFHIFSHTSSSRYSGSDKPSIPQIGRELGANFIIEGTIERQNEDVSIHVQVIHAENDDHIWANEFKGKWKDIFTLRATIALNIAEELKTVLSTEEVESIEKTPTNNDEAYNLYLKGRYFWNLRTEGGLEKSIMYFNQATEMDPYYAIAYSGLADAYSVLPWYSDKHPQDTYPKALNAAFKAMKLDSMLAEAHNSLAGVKSWYEYDRPGAEKEFKKAIELNPKYSTAIQWYGAFLLGFELYDEAIAEIKQALKYDPLSIIINQNFGEFLYISRQYEEAIEQFQKTLELYPEFYELYTSLGLVYLQKGMINKAIEEFNKSQSSDIIYAYMALGMEEEALAVLNECIERADRHQIISRNLIRAYHSIGEMDRVFELLDTAYQEHYPWFEGLFLYDPVFDNIRSDPRFFDLLKKIGFEIN